MNGVARSPETSDKLSSWLRPDHSGVAAETRVWATIPGRAAGLVRFQTKTLSPREGAPPEVVTVAVDALLIPDDRAGLGRPISQNAVSRVC